MNSEVFLFGSVGLTKREYIAVHLMAASMANGSAHPATHAASAVNAADCLIAELNKGELERMNVMKLADELLVEPFRSQERERLEADLKELRKERACANEDQRVWLDLDIANVRLKLEKL